MRIQTVSQSLLILLNILMDFILHIFEELFFIRMYCLLIGLGCGCKIFLPTTGCITIFRAIKVLCWTDSILQNIPHIQSECENIMQNNVSPA
jgi:hypothetical protein